MAKKGLIIPTHLDNSSLEQDFQKTKDTIEELEKELEAKPTQKSALEETLKKQKEEAEAGIKILREMNAEKVKLEKKTSVYGPENWQTYDADVKQLEQITANIDVAQSEQKGLTDQIKATEKEMADLEKDTKRQAAALEKAKDKAGKLAAKIQDVAKKEAKAAKKAEEVAAKKKKAAEQEKYQQSLMYKSGAAVDNFGKRLGTITKKVFVFTVIATALREVKEWMSKVMATNTEAMASMSKLKGALLTLAQPLVNVVIPAFTAFVNALAKVVTFLAAAFSQIMGTTAKDSAKAAKSLYEQTEALEGVGAAADEAAGSLAGFDEITQLTDSSAGSAGAVDSIAGATPDFSLDETSLGDFGDMIGPLKDLAGDVKAVFTDVSGFVKGILTGDFDLAADHFFNLLLGLSDLGVDLFLFVDELFGSIIDTIIEKCGLANTPVGNMLLGIKEGFHGLAEFVAGVFTGDFARAIGGLETILDGFKTFFDGIIDLNVGIFTGFIDKLDELTGGRFHAIFETIKGFLHNFGDLMKDIFGVLVDYFKDYLGGLIEFIVGVFTGDFDMALSGLGKVAKAQFNLILGTFGAVVNFFIRGLNWLIDKINTIKFEVPEWVPGIGGKGTGFNLPKVNEWQIPKLAQGAVIPPNREFLAILGDQKAGTNIEAPLATIKQAFVEAMAELGGAGGEQTIIVQCLLDGRKVAENSVKHINAMTVQAGKPVLVT